jgi:nucleotide-binding universal stress UspA family protein
MGLRPGPAASGRFGRRVQVAGMPESDGARGCHVLVAADGSEPSLRAVAYAVGLARRQGLKLVVLFVHTVSTMPATPETVCEMRRANTEAVAALRCEVARQTAECALDITLIQRSGSPYAEIVRLATLFHVDAVVVAAGMGFGHRLMASPAIRLARAARWPVTVVP